MIAKRYRMNIERVNAFGLARTHEPLNPGAADVVESVLRWHRYAGPNDWIEGDQLPVGAWNLKEGRLLSMFQSLGQPEADFHFGAELAVGFCKCFRPFVGDPAWYAVQSDEGGLASVAALFDPKPLANLRDGFFCTATMFLARALSQRSTWPAVLARLDAIDHAEAAARLACLLDGFAPVSLFSMHERFPLLSRPGEWVEWVGDRP